MRDIFILIEAVHIGLLTSKFQTGLRPLGNRRATDDRPTSGDARGKMPACDCCQNNHQINFCHRSMVAHLCL
jgi:hypothetical protein